MSSSAIQDDDLLWQQLKTLPAFRALLRAVEARFYQYVALADPILDVGCGDGNFAELVFPNGVTAGIDPWWGPLQKARRTDIYTVLSQSLGHQLPFPNDYFGGAFSNSVLEHIPDIQPVLNEVSRVLRPGARFLITMPSHLFTQELAGAEFFERLRLDNLANRYRILFNRISRHAHTDTPEVWGARLAQAGLQVEKWQYYFSRGALHALEFGHAQGVPSALLHAATGHWIVAPWESSLRPTERWLRPYYEEPFPNEGAYLVFVARKVAALPIVASLPPPQALIPGRWPTAACLK